MQVAWDRGFAEPENKAVLRNQFSIHVIVTGHVPWNIGLKQG